MLKSITKLGLLVVATAFVFLAVGCGPKYPNCESDEHCAEKGEYCVDKLCRECASNDNCVAKRGGDKCQRCGSLYTCEKIPGCCKEDRDCPIKCWKEAGADVGQCGPQCKSNEHCPAGQECVGERCVTPKVPCGGPCPAHKKCVNDRCEWECAFENVNFDFDAAGIKKDQKDKIQKNIDCAKQLGVNLLVEGHCDERGDKEYNDGLGEKRHTALRKYYKDKGLKVEIEGVSYGKDKPMCYESNEGCWETNRRAVTIPKE